MKFDVGNVYNKVRKQNQLIISSEPSFMTQKKISELLHIVSCSNDP